MRSKKSLLWRSASLLGTVTLAVTALHANDLAKLLQGLSDQGTSHYQPPPDYASGTGYYPYAPPPPEVNEVQRRQQAYDIGYRVGQDDFHSGHSKHFIRHPELFDEQTKDAFGHGYDSGYDLAREAAAARQKAYASPRVAPGYIKSEHYPSGYYPYTPPPQKASDTDQQRHAYDVGFRVGQDDFHHKLSKHFPRHEKLYTEATHESFAAGYEKGYDRARGYK
ncbi:MAG: hypothetical protein ACAI34_22145 [Verrucomicrobium sp.]